MPEVAIIMGSRSDWVKVLPAAQCLKEFGVEYSVHIMSAHRTPDEAAEFAAKACDTGYRVIIAAAGKAAHLAGVIAAHTVLPVIGIPIKSGTMDGLDSLLSVVQMPSGVPVASVAIDGAKNAAILAVQILSVQSDSLRQKLLQFKKDMAAQVKQDNAILQKEIESI